MISAVIIDDEFHCTKTLATLLERYCPEITVAAICHNGKDGLTAINELSPDLVFLDIEMPQMNGFELLKSLPGINFHLVFTTSYDQYALKAFRFSAIDYLLKPIDREELQAAVKKIIQKLQAPIPQQIEILLQKLKQPAVPVNKIALPTMEGLEMIPVDMIISCESDDNYTILLLKNRRKVIVSCTLKEIEENLEDYSFARVHRSYLVNLNEIDKYLKGEGGYLIMSDGSTIDVSRSKKESLLRKLLPKRD